MLFQHPWETRVSPKLFNLALLGTVLSSALSIGLLLDTWFTRDTTVLVNHPYKTLRRPSTYMNLGGALAKAKPIALPPIIRFPEIILQFDNTDALRVLREDTSRSYTSPDGSIFPDDQHFLITTKGSTCFLQLRSRDDDGDYRHQLWRNFEVSTLGWKTAP